MYKVSEEYLPAIEHYLKQAPNEEVRQRISEILYEGKYGSFEVNSNMMNKDNLDMEMCRRLNFASLLLVSPKTFEVLKKNNVTLFHGSNSVVLEGILENGICCEKRMVKEGIKVVTGEYSLDPRNFVSFTDDMDLALDYASIAPNNEKTSFGMLIGISADDLKSDDNDILYTTSIRSDVPEVGVLDKLPTENIKVIAVPEDKIPEVNRTLNKNKDLNINVVPVEDIIRATNMSIPFKESYLRSTGEYRTERDVNSLSNIEGNSNSTKNFNNSDVKKLAKTRILSKIKEAISRFGKEKNREEEKEI